MSLIFQISVLSKNIFATQYYSSADMECVLYTEGWVCDVALIEYTLGSGEIQEGLGFWKEGTRGQWGTKGVSLRATWDRGGRFLSQLEGAK
jgi:hypothetical protein